MTDIRLKLTVEDCEALEMLILKATIPGALELEADLRERVLNLALRFNQSANNARLRELIKERF